MQGVIVPQSTTYFAVTLWKAIIGMAHKKIIILINSLDEIKGIVLTTG